MVSVGMQIFELFINVFETFIMLVFITLYLGPKYKGWKLCLGFFAALAAGFAEITIVNYLTVIETFESYLSLAIFFLYAVFVLHGEWAQKLWAAVVTQVTMNMISLVSIPGFCMALRYPPIDLVSVYNSTRVKVILAIQVICIVVYFLLLRFKTNRPMKTRLWLAISVIPWVSLPTMPLLVQLSLEYPQYQKSSLMSMLCILVANGMSYYFIAVIGRSHENHLKVKLLEQQNKNRRKEMESASAFLEEMRRVRHDMTNQLFIIKGNIIGNQSEEAEHYIDRLIGEFLPGEVVTSMEDGGEKRRNDSVLRRES